MRLVHFCLVLLFFVPTFALGQSTGAGFATHSLFLSQSSVTEGEKVLIYTSIANTSQEAFSGTLKITEGNLEIGRIDITFGAGEAKVISIAWQPTKGSHSITAQLIRSDGVSMGKTSATFIVDPKVEPTTTNNEDPASDVPVLTVESSQPLEEKIAGLSPSIANAVVPVFTAIDGIRSRSSEALTTQLTHTKPKLPGQLFSGTSNNSIKDTALGALWTLYYYALTVLNYIISKLVFFYPVLVILFFWLLLKLRRLFSRPH